MKNGMAIFRMEISDRDKYYFKKINILVDFVFSILYTDLEVYRNNFFKILRKKIMHEVEFCCSMIEKTRIKSKCCFLVVVF